MRIRKQAKTFSATAFVLALLFSAVVGIQLVSLGGANPYKFYYGGEVPPDYGTRPPTITIFSPENDKSYRTEDVALCLNVSVGYSSTATSRFLWDIRYHSDWQPDDVYIYKFIPETNAPTLTEYSTTLNLTGIPGGKRNITVFATERGQYEKPDPGSAGFATIYYTFEVTGSLSINFTVDDIPPRVSILSPKNNVYNTYDVPLNFTVSELVSQITYSLDGQDNITVAENTTLTSLSNGKHNITVYAWDIAGNIGTSRTMFFTVKVPEPLPTTLVATASGASVAAIGVGLMVYFKKRKR